MQELTITCYQKLICSYRQKTHHRCWKR